MPIKGKEMHQQNFDQKFQVLERRFFGKKGLGVGRAGDKRAPQEGVVGLFLDQNLVLTPKNLTKSPKTCFSSEHSLTKRTLII